MARKGSTIIDHRIVEMRFDNKQFEAGTKQTLGTLSKLKEALKLPNSAKAFKEIDEASKNIKLDGIASAVDSLNRRFSFLGETVRNISNNIRDALISGIKKPMDWVTDSIVSGGVKRAMNIENAHFQLQALLKDEAKVQAVMADAMESVDGTAYAYDEAAKAAAQFSASGIQAGDDMLAALKGITGVAAMTNSQFADISMIFTTVAGNGRLMGDQLLQLSSRGLNAASTIADYFREVRGQAGMTEGTIREMVSKGRISFKDFSDAMTWAFGDSAKRANETFTGAMSNMKSALARIGAGFISPLIEQNGELVNLFNALRIKINDVKSSLVFDEQTSAVSGLSKEMSLMDETLSKYLTNGTIGFEEITKALTGMTGEEQKFEKVNEELSGSFKLIKENGKLTSESLESFSKRGINVTVALRDYINGVNKGTIQASDSMKQMIKEISGGTWVINSDIDKMIKEGVVNFDLFSSSITHSSREVFENAFNISESIKGMLKDVKDSGKVTSQTLVDFSDNGVNATKALMDYMNGVNKGTVRATYATKQQIEELSQGVHVTTLDIKKMAEEGSISFDIFQSAMENAYGDMKPLSKQFTDFFLDNIKKLVTAINEADMTKPMEIFYYWVESGKNGVKGLLSVVEPLAKAFADVFLNFDSDDIITFSQAVEKLTSKMKLSEKGSKNLHDAFQGVFSILKLLMDVGFKFLSVFVPINAPILDMGDGVLGLAGSLGRLLTKFSDGVRSCTLLKKAFNGLSSGVRKGINTFEGWIKIIKDYASTFFNLEDANKIIDNIISSFNNLSFEGIPSIKDVTNAVTGFMLSLISLSGINIDNVETSLKNLFSIPMKNEGFAIFVNNFIQYIKDLKAAFKISDEVTEKFRKGDLIGAISEYVENIRKALSFEGIYNQMKKMMSVFNIFFDWIRDKFGPSFKQLSVGSVIGAGGGVAIIYSFVKIAKAFSSLSGAFSKTITSIPGTLTAVKGALDGYQKDLKANALIKVAGAIAILAGALVLLSFTDPKRLLTAALALSTVSGVIMFALAKLKESFSMGKYVDSALSTFATGVSKTMNKLGRAVEFKALGSMIKDFAKAILLIGLTVAGLGLMYKKDKDSLMAGVKLVEEIGLCLAAIMGVTVIIASLIKDKTFKNIGSIALSVVGVATSLLLIVRAMNKLFKMDFPADWQFKLKVLAGILSGLGALAIVLGLASKLGGGNQLASAGTIVSLAILLASTTSALNKLFKMELPRDYNEKIKILYHMFTAISELMIALGIASKLAGGALKATGAILSMAVFLMIVVGSLMVLSLMPAEKLENGAKAIGVILIALGRSLFETSKVASEDTWKTILSLVAAIGSIIIGLSVLSDISWQDLLKATLSMGLVMIALSKCIDSISEASGDKKTLIAMGELIASLIVVSYSLYKLSSQPWKGMLAAGTAMSATFISFAKAYQMILKKDWSKNTPKKLAVFAGMIAATIPVAVELGVLAHQPWDGLLAASTAMSGTMLAFAKAYQMILKPNWGKNNTDKIEAFGLMVIATIPIAIELGALANQPWEGLLAAAVSLSSVLMAMTTCMAVLTTIKANVGVATQAALALDAFVGIVGALMLGLGLLFSQDVVPLEGVLDKGIEILIKIGDGLGRALGALVSGAMSQIASGLPQIGTDLSNFMINLTPFLILSKLLDAESVACVGFLSAIIGALLVDEFINGIASLFNLHMADLGTELSNFMIALTPFIIGSHMIKAENMEAVGYIAEIISALTKSQTIEGIGKIFGLSGGTLADFGSQLSDFGPYLKDFADSVKDVTPEMVQGAAAAAEIMANLANKLPGIGGLAQKIFGEKKSLSEFGAELLAFGPSIRLFSIMVNGVTPESVEGAAAAGEIMANLANKLPTTDSLWSKVFGNNVTLSEFGSELILFGPLINLFAHQVASISPASVIGAAMATSIMSTIANNLPEATSLKSKLFGGNMKLSEFGLELVEFGTAMKAFSDSLGGINIITIAGCIQSFKDLIDLTNYAQNATPDSLSKFSDSLGDIGTEGAVAFCGAFDNSYDAIISSVNRFVNQFMIAFQNKYKDYKDKGTESATKYINGFPVKHPAAGVAGMLLAKAVISALEKMYPSFKLAGSNSADQYLLGFTLQSSKASLAASALIGNTLAGLESLTSGFTIAGANAGNGFLDGLKSKMDDISKAGSALGEAALKASKEALDEHSPSKEYDKVGEFAGIAFVNKLLSYVTKSRDAGKMVGESSIKGLQSAVNSMMSLLVDDEFVFEPRISPVVNLGDVRRSTNEISKLFNDAVQVTAQSAGVISQMEYDKNKSRSNRFNNGNNGNGDTYVNFEQNNYSPKALSAIEIYRQTNNQIGMLKTRLKQK